MIWLALTKLSVKWRYRIVKQAVLGNRRATRNDY
jgi:hypothetical protein